MLSSRRTRSARPGPAGPAGPEGARGPSDAFGVFRNTISPPPLAANATVTLATLSLQAGRYVVFGKVDFDDISGAPRTVTCRLGADRSALDRALQTVSGVGGENYAVMAALDISSATTVTAQTATPVSSQGCGPATRRSSPSASRT